MMVSNAKREVVIVSGARTPIGRFGGSLMEVSAADLGSLAIKTAIERAGIDPKNIDEVVLGCTVHVGEDTNIARVCALKAGIPFEAPAFTVNCMCISGLEAINTASRYIESGDAEIVVAGGTENMSLMPYILRGARWGYRMGTGTLEDAMENGPLRCAFNHYHLAITGENLAQKYAISRTEQDAFALRSHQRAFAAVQAGSFKNEIIPVSVPQKKGEVKIIDTDEHPRADTTLERLSKLAPAFKKDGTVTAGNASGINDAAAAVVLMSREKAQKLGMKTMFAVRARANAGVDPSIMGISPAYAVRKALNIAGLSLNDLDLVELNEAFAAQSIAVDRELKLNWQKTNVNGGAIGLGHPVGATGAILIVKLIYEMQRRGSRYGVASLCAGGGIGVATILEKLGS
jgi:acetyl-CoA C-acetyltransferase